MPWSPGTGGSDVYLSSPVTLSRKETKQSNSLGFDWLASPAPIDLDAHE